MVWPERVPVGFGLDRFQSKIRPARSQEANSTPLAIQINDGCFWTTANERKSEGAKKARFEKSTWSTQALCFRTFRTETENSPSLKRDCNMRKWLDSVLNEEESAFVLYLVFCVTLTATSAISSCFVSLHVAHCCDG
jgi:hypothetical protein